MGNKTNKPNTGGKLFFALLVLSGTAFISKYREHENNPKAHKIISPTVIGEEVDLYPNALAYSNPKEAMLEQNGQERYFNAEREQYYFQITGQELDRKVECAWYECGTEIVCANTPEEEQRILMNGGILVAIKTSIDGQTEACYSASGIDESKKKKVNIKINGKSLEF